MIQVQVIGLDKSLTMLGRVPLRARDAVHKSLMRIAYGVQRKVQHEKLKGQVLHQRSGRLSESIHVEDVSRDNILEATVGTNVVYARAHEYGFHKTVPVKEHTATRKATGKTWPVRAHDMKMNLPERSFLRSSLREYYTTALSDLNKTVKRVSSGDSE